MHAAFAEEQLSRLVPAPVMCPGLARPAAALHGAAVWGPSSSWAVCATAVMDGYATPCASPRCSSTHVQNRARMVSACRGRVQNFGNVACNTTAPPHLPAPTTMPHSRKTRNTGASCTSQVNCQACAFPNLPVATSTSSEPHLSSERVERQNHDGTNMTT